MVATKTSVDLPPFAHPVPEKVVRRIEPDSRPRAPGAGRVSDPEPASLEDEWFIDDDHPAQIDPFDLAGLL